MAVKFKLGDIVCYRDEDIQQRAIIKGCYLKLTSEFNINDRIERWDSEFDIEYLLESANWSFPSLNDRFHRMKKSTFFDPPADKLQDSRVLERAGGHNEYPNSQPKYSIGSKVLCEYESLWYRSIVVGYEMSSDLVKYKIWYMNWAEHNDQNKKNKLGWNNPELVEESQLKDDFYTEDYKTTAENPVNPELL